LIGDSGIECRPLSKVNKEIPASPVPFIPNQLRRFFRLSEVRMTCNSKFMTLCSVLFTSLIVFQPVRAEQERKPPAEPPYRLSSNDTILTTVRTPAAPPSAPPPGILPSDANPQLDIGVGYDSMSDEVRPKCVVETSTALPLPESEGQNGRMLLSYVTSEDDLARSLGISANASFGNGVFNADASVQYLSSSKMTSYDSYLLVTSGNENAKQLLPKYTLTRSAKDALKSGVLAFQKLCGDQFVRGRITGGSISAVLSASSTTTQEQIDAAATLHAAGWGGSIDAATQSKLESFQSSGRLNMQIIRQGPAEAWPASTVTDLISYAQTFPAKVATHSGSAWVISYIVSTYDEIFNSWNTPAPQIAFYSREGPYLRQLYRARNDYSYIAANPDQFGATSNVKLTNEIASLTTEIGSARSAADICLSDQSKCPELQHLPLSGAPDRVAPWTALDPTVNTYRTYFTVIAPDERIIELVGDFWTQCDNHGAGRFGPTQWDVQFVSIKSGAILYDGAYPGRPLRVPEDSIVNVHVIDAYPGDNCGVADHEPKVRLFTPVFPDDYK
jgi:hypothetical protein